MATVAPSTAVTNQIVGPALRISVRDVTLSSSYTTGGEAITAAQFGIGAIFFCVCTVKTPAATSCTEVLYDASTGKIKCNGPTGEVANTTNLSALVVEVVAFGRD